MTQDLQQCYVCYESQSDTNPFALSPPPCICMGSIAIHTKCLNKIIKTTRICSICKTKYNLHYLPQRHGLELIIDALEYGKQIEYTINASGEKHGLSTVKNQDGSIMSKYCYLNGILHGPFIEYYWNGHMKRLGQYKNGLQDGDYCEWYEDGTLLEESKHVDGVKHGQCTYYMKDGYITVSNVVNYINGEGFDADDDSCMNKYRDEFFN